MSTDDQMSTNTGHAEIRAIVVDDDADVREIFIELLQMNDIKVVANGINGKEAVELYKMHHPDFVFLDYLMPEYDGLYAIEQIREFDPNGKIILVSGSHFERNVLGDTVKAIIKKPIEISEIFKAINRITLTT
ncbi:CheY-like receiver [Nitrosotalea devaniterrae]|uniref:CheY-like receiver n=1 Tax=Nitrosotalea devaniterrae TaxID=1078905 RepID=A0A128A1I3_9ARCH|nr:CheY-like receiver [Candidatus Nitrosotalea devanaterra]